MVVDEVLPDGHGVAARPSASAISSRYGSHALALGARPGRGTGAESVDTSALVAGLPVGVGGHRSEMAGFDRPESVDTTGGEIAGFAPIRSGALVHAPEAPQLSDSR